MIKKAYDLKKISTFGIGGKAEFFAEISNAEELTKAVKFAKDSKINITVIGECSNLIISDDGVKGLVIKFKNKNIREIKSDENVSILEVDAGVVWDDFVAFCVENSLYGVENLSKIPGSVGACGVQNIGAYGQQASDVIKYINCYDLEHEKLVKIDAVNCGFSYRKSIFNSTFNCRYLILNVGFELRKKADFSLGYKDMAYFRNDENITLKKIRNEVINIREKKLPDYNLLPNVGSFFKNLELNKDELNDLYNRIKMVSSEQREELKMFKSEKEIVKIPTAFLIEICGLKGYKWDNVGIYENHSLIVINHTKKATSKEVLEFSDYVSDCIYNKLGVRIEREPTFIE